MVGWNPNKIKAIFKTTKEIKEEINIRKGMLRAWPSPDVSSDELSEIEDEIKMFEDVLKQMLTEQ